MNTPKELKYAKTHEWVRFTSETECEVGLSDFAQDALGDLAAVGPTGFAAGEANLSTTDCCG